jgi:hypothetical protein
VSTAVDTAERVPSAIVPAARCAPAIAAVGIAESGPAAIEDGADPTWVAATAVETIRAAPVSVPAVGVGGLGAGVRCRALGAVVAVGAGLEDGDAALGDVDGADACTGAAEGVCVGAAVSFWVVAAVGAAVGVCVGATAGAVGVCAGAVGDGATALVAACVTCPTAPAVLCTTAPSAPESAAAALPALSSSVRHVTPAPMPRRTCFESGCRALRSIEAV